eukprot:COSAG06_NODE_20_length_33882_cov_18.856969_5_plen_463_part_00
MQAMPAGGKSQQKVNPDRVRRGTLALGARAGTSVEAMLLAATDEFDEDEDEEAELLQSLKDGVAFGAEDPDTPRFVPAVGTVQKMNAGIAAFQTGRPSTPPAMQTISEAADPPGAAQPTQQHEAAQARARSRTSSEPVATAAAAATAREETPSAAVGPEASLSDWLRAHGASGYTTALCSAFGTVEDLVEYTESAEDLRDNFALPVEVAEAIWSEILAERSRREEQRRKRAMQIMVPGEAARTWMEDRAKPEPEPEPEPEVRPLPQRDVQAQLRGAAAAQEHSQHGMSLSQAIEVDSERAAEVLRGGVSVSSRSTTGATGAPACHSPRPVQQQEWTSVLLERTQPSKAPLLSWRESRAEAPTKSNSSAAGGDDVGDMDRRGGLQLLFPEQSAALALRKRQRERRMRAERRRAAVGLEVHWHMLTRATKAMQMAEDTMQVTLASIKSADDDADVAASYTSRPH